MTTADAYELATSETVLIDSSERAKLTLAGSGAVEFLQGQVTNDVEALGAGEGCYAAFLNPKGKLRADVRVLRTEEGLWLDAEPYAKQVVEWVIDSFSVGLDVRREDRTGAEAILSLVGPGADALLDRPPAAAEHSHATGEHGRYVRTGWGIDVICPAARAAAARAALGAPQAPPEVAEILRVEAGRPRLGLDMDATTIPQEAGLNERAVSFEKGCYVGQETVARLHWRGRPNRHLRGLALSEPAERGAPIALGEREIGSVGSAVLSPRLGPIALALVRREAQPGEQVLVGGSPATVVELPFAR